MIHQSLTVEISLEDFGAEGDHREYDSRIYHLQASEFGVYDRPEVTQSSESDLSNLLTDTAEDQRTLTEEQAGGRCLFETQEEDSRGIIARLQGFPTKGLLQTQ